MRVLPLLARALALLLGLAAAPAAAQSSSYGCTELTGLTGLPSVEGSGGVFYRIDPDLKMFHGLSDDSVADLARLSQTLAAFGTTLIYVPLPTKSLVLPDALPQEARDFGFDPALAATVYGETLKRLWAAGVPATDARRALHAPADQAPSVFATDYRLTGPGAQRLARAISETVTLTPGYSDLPKGRFQTRSTGAVTLDSAMRSKLQRHCLTELPPVQTESFATSGIQANLSGTNNTIFGSRTTSARIALLGTETTGEPAINFAGFLSEFTGLDVVQYSVPGGGAFAAISSYLTSAEFQDQRPAYLVWTNPVEENLARFGDQPFRELTAAAGADCRVPLPLLSSGQPNTITADLRALDRSQPYTLLVEAEGAPAAAARFDFLSGNGLVRSRSVVRHPDQVRTGRFYMPMSGLWPEGAQSVDIQLDVPFGGSTRVTACFD